MKFLGSVGTDKVVGKGIIVYYFLVREKSGLVFLDEMCRFWPRG